jgi:signal recognition particle subunit SEC65
MGRTSDGMMMAIPAPHGVLFQELSAKEFAHVLREVASSVNRSRDQKHPRGPKNKPTERTAYQHGKHVSTAKLLAQR